MSRPVSLLDGPYAYAWAKLGLGAPRVASQRSTTSSRTPGKVNRGAVYRRDFEHPELHLCACGQTQKQCPSCAAWVCAAPGHAPHVCGSAW